MKDVFSGKLHLLVVEDSIALHEWASSREAEMCGVRVSVSGNPDRALSATASGEVDVVLLDAEAPNDSGLALIRRLRSNHPAIPVIALVSPNNPLSTFAALNDGAAAFIHKPLALSKIEQVIPKFHRAMREQRVEMSAPTCPLRSLEVAV